MKAAISMAGLTGRNRGQPAWTTSAPAAETLAAETLAAETLAAERG